jgi:hypothetical protein
VTADLRRQRATDPKDAERYRRAPRGRGGDFRPRHV